MPSRGKEWQELVDLRDAIREILDLRPMAELHQNKAAHPRPPARRKKKRAMEGA
jgi:hypothetical protein